MKYNFIIPYRNRKEQLNEFIRKFTEYLKDKEIDAQFYIVHQIHTGEFNRGALKNIGFLEVCKTRSDGLFIFHDVDIYPKYWGAIQYDSKEGMIRHPIGFTTENLGGICCFWKKEFEQVNGFPNYWGWGIEDNTILLRVNRCGLRIDKSNAIDLNDSKKCYNPGHYRSPKNTESARKNTILYNIEKTTGDFSNGLSSLEYTILSSFELAPRFTIINVDFTIKENLNETYSLIKSENI